MEEKSSENNRRMCGGDQQGAEDVTCTQAHDKDVNNEHGDQDLTTKDLDGRGHDGICLVESTIGNNNNDVAPNTDIHTAVMAPDDDEEAATNRLSDSRDKVVQQSDARFATGHDLAFAKSKTATIRTSRNKPDQSPNTENEVLSTTIINNTGSIECQDEQQLLQQPGAIAIAGPNNAYMEHSSTSIVSDDSSPTDEDESPSLPVLIARRVETSDIEDEIQQRIAASEVELRQRLEVYERQPVVHADLIDTIPSGVGDEESSSEQDEDTELDHGGATKRYRHILLCMILLIALIVTVVVVVIVVTAADFGGNVDGSDTDVAGSSSETNTKEIPTNAPTTSFIPVCFESSETLFQTVDQYLDDVGEREEGSDLAQSYGLDMTSWCVSRISNFSRLFSADRNPSMEHFNADISAWNLSSAIDTSYMFQRARSFNVDLSSWDVSAVEDMEGMFDKASSLDQELSAWNVSRVKSMRGIFHNASSFNTDISSWDVSSVEDMSYMFWNASSFNQNLAAWDVSKVKNMHAMFYLASRFNKGISAWNVSSVNDMTEIFFQSRSL